VLTTKGLEILVITIINYLSMMIKFMEQPKYLNLSEIIKNSAENAWKQKFSRVVLEVLIIATLQLIMQQQGKKFI